MSEADEVSPSQAGVVREGQLLWTPRPAFAEGSNIAAYLRWLAAERGVELADYDALQRWSTADIETFWASIWDYFEIRSSTPYRSVLDSHAMPGARWFSGSRVNYAEHLLRHEAEAGDRTALHYRSECRAPGQMTWRELGRQVRILATQLRALGVRPGDRVVSYMPNIPETAVAMMASVAIGAIWAQAAPEFGVETVIDRFVQIEPKLMFAADGYRFAGKDILREPQVRRIVAALPSLQRVVWLPYLRPAQPLPEMPLALSWNELMMHREVPREAFRYERVECDHPLWVLFSSGTTGLPKAIVHSHVGVLVELLKMLHFHVDIKPDSTMFFYSTTGWMMWNFLLSALLTGAAAVLYDGSPTHPDESFLWDLAADTGVTAFGASPTFVQIMEKAGLRPGERYDLSRLESIFVSGAPATPETFDWFYRCVKRDLWVTSQSGGTDLCSGLVGGVPTLPVRAGEIQARLLGMDVRAWSENGEDLVDEFGELVVTQPFPSMPIKFWNDEDGHRYRDAYFADFPGVWRHGDYIRINRHGGCYIRGRSDSTLNRYGVRIGTAEIYRVVEHVDGVADSLVVCCELPGGKFFMPLFLRMKPGTRLDEDTRNAVIGSLREKCSPRHVPDCIYEVKAIPYTLTGKKMEVPVRKILMGWPLEKCASRDAMNNPEAIDWYVRFAQESIDYQWRPTPAVGGR